MKIGVIGLGSIAQEAYLPVYTSQFPEHEWFFVTRTEKKLFEIGKKYGLTEDHLFTDWKEIADVVDAVFIHTPTVTHREICEAFLRRNIPVLIDKPMTNSLEETKELAEISKETGTLLMTGFNRRFAPMVNRMKETADKNHLILQKNQVDKTDYPVRFRVYDAMIHPIDTALYLLGEPANIVDSSVVLHGDEFLRAWVSLETETASAYVSINNQSGTKRETFEVQSPKNTVILENLTDLTTYTADEKSQVVTNYWDSTLLKRGFSPMIKAFIDTVTKGAENPVPLETVIESHRICEEIIQAYEQDKN